MFRKQLDTFVMDIATDLKVCILLTPSDSCCCPLRHLGDLDLKEPAATVDKEIGADIAVELVTSQALAILRHCHL